jgi:hypothetical protein
MPLRKVLIAGYNKDNGVPYAQNLKWQSYKK